jgi:hypothetical protein
LWAGGFRTTQNGVENVSIEDVDGEGPFAGVRPNASGGGIADEGEDLSVIVESRPLCMNPTTVSVCEGDIVGAEATLWGDEDCRTVCSIHTVNLRGYFEGGADTSRYGDTD